MRQCNSGECSECLKDEIDNMLASSVNKEAICNCGSEYCFACNYMKTIDKQKELDLLSEKLSRNNDLLKKIYEEGLL